ncbi:MAG: class D beta-lactamase [Cyanobacteria bacterium]|nr:class D beta-lactamase [Cyanobacteriota bacterium]
MFNWKQGLSYVLCTLMIGLLPARADVGMSDKVAKCFGKLDGTFVMRDTAGKTVCKFNDELASKAISPCSTFKIVIGLIGLETGAIKDENEIEKWDGVKHPVDTWNKDHNLKSAMSEYVNWYFQRVSAKIGEKELAKYLKLLHYGNENMSSGLDNFWMGETGSLRITPTQQVEFLEQLYAEKLPLSARSQQIVKRMLKCDEGPNGVLFGKTGTDQRDGKLVSGWFVGFVESKNGNYVFATHVDGPTGVTGAKAREISKKILAELGDW